MRLCLWVGGLAVILLVMILVTSKFKHYEKDADGVRRPCVIPDENGILSLMRQHLPRTDRLLVVANDPHDFALNDAVAAVLAQACQLTGLCFREVKVLDQRTAAQAASLVAAADLIFVCGGEVLRQLVFLQQIAFKRLIQDCAGVVLTVSAASMCLTRTICNFPERSQELGQPRLVAGLGLLDLRLIPHFDGESMTYQGTTDLPNLVTDYLLPYSDDGPVCGLPNGSFICLDGGAVTFYGPCYQILRRVVAKMV